MADDKLSSIEQMEYELELAVNSVSEIEKKLAQFPKSVVYLFKDQLDYINNLAQRQIIRCETHKYNMDNDRIEKLKKAGM